MYFWVNISWFLINTRVYLAFSSANWFHCTCFPVFYDCLVLKKKFINCSLISYVFLACWFGFLKICEEKNPLFSLLVSILTGQYGWCSEAEDYVIWVLVNLLRFLLSRRTYSMVYSMSICLLVCWSFLLFLSVLMVQLDFIYARQVLYHWLSFCSLFLYFFSISFWESLSLRMSLTLSLVNPVSIKMSCFLNLMAFWWCAKNLSTLLHTQPLSDSFHFDIFQGWSQRHTGL